MNNYKKASELGLETIELEDQVLLSDKNSEYQTNGWAFNNGKGVFWVNMSDRYPSGYKFIASTKQLEGVPLLVIEDEAKKLSFEEFPISMDTRNNITRDTNSLSRDPFVKGYNKAKETYKFTEADLRGVFLMGLIENISGILNERELDKSEIESLFLKQLKRITKKELWIEFELHQIKVSDKTGYTKESIVPKITNNQIKAVWK